MSANTAIVNINFSECNEIVSVEIARYRRDNVFLLYHPTRRSMLRLLANAHANSAVFNLRGLGSEGKPAPWHLQAIFDVNRR